MSHFRFVHRCVNCGKIYRSEYFPMLYGDNISIMLCGRCGCRRFERVVARPRWFGLRGWDVGTVNRG